MSSQRTYVILNQHIKGYCAQNIYKNVCSWAKMSWHVKSLDTINETHFFRYLLSDWAYNNITYIFGMYASRLRIWVLLKDCAAPEIKLLEFKLLFYDFNIFWNKNKNSYNFVSRSCTDLWRYSNSSSWNAHSKYVGNKKVDQRIQELFGDLVCSVYYVKILLHEDILRKQATYISLQMHI